MIKTVTLAAVAALALNCSAALAHDEPRDVRAITWLVAEDYDNPTERELSIICLAEAEMVNVMKQEGIEGHDGDKEWMVYFYAGRAAGIADGMKDWKIKAFLKKWKLEAATGSRAEHKCLENY